MPLLSQMVSATLVVITREGCPPCATLESHWKSFLKLLERSKLPIRVRKIKLNARSHNAHQKYPAPIRNCNWTPAFFLLEQEEWEQAVEKEKKEGNQAIKNFVAFGVDYPQKDPRATPNHLRSFPYSFAKPQSLVEWCRDSLKQLEEFSSQVYRVEKKEQPPPTPLTFGQPAATPKKRKVKNNSSSSVLFCTSTKCYQTVPKK